MIRLQLFLLLPAATLTQQDDCISTFGDFWQHFTNSVDAECVSPDLYVTIQGPCGCAVDPSPCGSAVSANAADVFGWVSGSAVLEAYLT